MARSPTGIHPRIYLKLAAEKLASPSTREKIYGNISKIFIAVIAFWFVVIFDAFGIQKLTDQISRDYASRFISYFSDLDEANDVAVVLIEDDYLNVVGGWPPSFGNYHKLVQRLEAARPASITLDLLFSNKLNPELSSGAERFKSYIQDPTRETPIYLAHDADAKQVMNLSANADEELVSVSWTGNDGYYPQRGGDEVPTPAFRIYEQFFGEIKSKSDLYPIWPQKNTNFIQQFNFGHKKKRMDVIHTISAKDVVSATWPQKRESFNAFLQDKHVMLGAKITGSPDIVESPVYGDLAGVYLHAVALQNLIYFGDDYYKNSEYALFGIDANTAIEILAILATAFIFWKFTKRTSRLSTFSANYIKITFVFFFINIAIILAAVSATILSKLSPANFIGLIVLAPMLYEMAYALMSCSIRIIGEKLCRSRQNYVQ